MLHRAAPDETIGSASQFEISSSSDCLSGLRVQLWPHEFDRVFCAVRPLTLRLRDLN